MKITKALWLIGLLSFSSIAIYAQENSVISFSELYMKNQHPLGYIIHTLSGEIIQYEKFEKKAYKKGAKVQVDRRYLNDAVITLVFGNANVSRFPLKDNLDFDLMNNYPYSPNNAGRVYQVDFSQVEPVKAELGFWGTSLGGVERGQDIRKQVWYNFTHPLFLPYNFSAKQEYKFITYPPIAGDKYPQLVLQDGDVATSNDFLDIELVAKDSWKCTALLFSKTNESPYLLFGETQAGQSSLALPVPEQLAINKIGLISKANDLESYSTFYHLDKPLIQVDNGFRDRNIDHQISQTVIDIPDNDISFYYLCLDYENWEEVKFGWRIAAKNLGGMQMVLPEVPEEITGDPERNELFKSPQSGHFIAYLLPKSVDISSTKFNDFFDVYWRLQHNAMLYNFYYEW